ncbi:MAG: XRE family transcriptional regulator [Bacteroides sp.]|nr:XRE family transcriptional regulator [Bacteroides sp.]MDE6222756.1 XRE family transcriptional regulator [Muribaculaceae bacterium]
MMKIENEQQYRRALSRIEELLPLVDDNTPLTNPNSVELDLLSSMVANYSNDHYSISESLQVSNIDANIILGV